MRVFTTHSTSIKPCPASHLFLMWQQITALTYIECHARIMINTHIHSLKEHLRQNSIKRSMPVLGRWSCFTFFSPWIVAKQVGASWRQWLHMLLFEQGILAPFKNYFWKQYLGNQSSEQKNTYKNLEEKESMGCLRVNFIFFFHIDFLHLF